MPDSRSMSSQPISLRVPKRQITGYLMAMDLKVPSVAQAVAAAEKWKKGLFADVYVTRETR